jgi:hypothetical protein
MAGEEEAVQKGARITLKEIEDEVFKSPLTPVIDKGEKATDKRRVKIEGFDFTNNGKDLKMLAVSNCEDIVITRCRFSGKDLVDVALNIDGADTKRVIIEYCIFENMTSKVSNGGEPIRLGNSARSGCFFDCIVRKCIFRNLNADPETISLKSADNEVCDNYFIDNTSMVTVRHGGLAKIHHNTFIGNHGIRLLGYGNVCSYNLHKDNSSTEKNSPYQIQYGNVAKDPNWDEVDEPSDDDGKSHNEYAQCVDNQLNFNEFVNCKNTIYYRKGEELAPINLQIRDKPSEPEPEQPPVVEPPPQPEPGPTPEPPAPTTPQCGICRKEDAIKKLTLTMYVGVKHHMSLRTALIELLKEMRAEVVEEQEEASATPTTTDQFGVKKIPGGERL